MNHKNFQKYLEYAMFFASLSLLAFFVVRTYILYKSDWDYIRGPLAPREYYELGMLDDPIPSKEYYPYTLSNPPSASRTEEIKASEPEKTETIEESTKDLSESDENSRG